MSPPPSLQPPPPLRSCLLSGGASHRMGQDKALLPHPEGGTWLERQLRLLAGVAAPVSLLSGWSSHLERAATLARQQGLNLELLDEPQPPEGPLGALGRLMEIYPEGRLLLCPIDMPALTPSCLQDLLRAASGTPGAIWIAASERPQPLLGLYPTDAHHRRSLQQALARGERGLQRWLGGERVHTLALPATALANVNTPEELANWRATAALKSPPDCSANRCSP